MFQESSQKEFRDIDVQTDPIDLYSIIASNEKLLSCTINSQYMKDYHQTVQDPSNSVTPRKIHSPKRSIVEHAPSMPSLLDMDPEELNNIHTSSRPNNRDTFPQQIPVKHDT